MKKILFVAFLAILLSRPAGAAPKINDTAPAFSLPDRGNTSVSLNDFIKRTGQSKGVVLGFFASWCIQCRHELPVLNSLVDELNRNGIAVVIIGVKEDYQQIEALLAELNVDKPVVLSDPRGKVAQLYQIRFLPVTYFVGSDGKVKDIIFGGITDKAEVMKSAEKLLK